MVLPSDGLSWQPTPALLTPGLEFPDGNLFTRENQGTPLAQDMDAPSAKRLMIGEWKVFREKIRALHFSHFHLGNQELRRMKVCSNCLRGKTVRPEAVAEEANPT